MSLLARPIRLVKSFGLDLLNELGRLVFLSKYGNGVDVMKEDWDNLIILDACRYDYFEELCDISGESNRVVSKGSASDEFIEKNFRDREFHDTIYISANPWVETLPEGTFYTIRNMLQKWDPDIGTVFPEDVVDASIRTHEEYPNKRLIIHFMQPHEPWLGPTGDDIRTRLSEEYDRESGFHKHHAIVDDVSRGNRGFNGVRDGHVSEDEMRQAYSENLNIVLEEIERLLAEISGKSVITADHGELLGDGHWSTVRRYVHPTGVYVPELRFVPWLEVPTDSRREVFAEEPIGHEQMDKGEVNQRLQALGYK